MLYLKKPKTTYDSGLRLPKIKSSEVFVRKLTRKIVLFERNEKNVYLQTE